MNVRIFPRWSWQMTDLKTHRLDEVRDGIAWLLCFCFFIMVPLEFASLEWIKTGKGTWLILQAQELDPLMSILSFLWSSAVLVGTILFLLLGCWSRFSYEREQRDEGLNGLDIAYYSSWIQTLSMFVSFVFYCWPSFGEISWISLVSPYMTQMWMCLLGFLLFRHGWKSLGMTRPNRGFWLFVPLVILAVYLLVYFYLDRMITEPIAQYFSLELSSWREESISHEIRQAQQMGWLTSAMQLLMLGLIGPVAEEIFFRGALQQVVSRWVGAGAGIFLSAALFALFHVDVALLAPLFVLGFLLACFRVWFKNLWAPILFHVLNNSVSVVLDWLHF